MGKSTLKRKLALSTLFLISFCAATVAQSSHHSKPKVIQGSGCIEKGVETSCHVVVDAKTGNTYTLLFSGKAPKSGTAIWFKGTQHQGMSTCMQGKPVSVSKWKKEKGIKCPPAAAPAPTH